MRAIVVAAVALLGATPAICSTLPAPVQAAPPHAADSIAYVIVTPRALTPAFMRLARAHTRDGLRAAVWTYESIESTYPGRDAAERLRAFLQQVHRERHARWLLIGAAHGSIPMRQDWGDPVIGEPFDTDQYYACLDGDWNADGDDRWGEGNDQVDVTPELIVGRAPVTTMREAERFVDRAVAAIDARGPARRASVLLVASRFAGGIVDGALFAERFARAIDVPPGDVTRLYESAAAYPGSQPLTRESALEALDDGHALTVMIGPGAPGLFALHDAADGTPRVTLTTDDFAALENRPPGIVCFSSAYTCAPGAASSIGEALVDDPLGGASAVLGPTGIQFVGGVDHAIEIMLRASRPTIGEAWNAALASVSRLTAEGMVLLGDPAVPMPIAGRPAPVVAVDDAPTATASFAMAAAAPVARVRTSAAAAGPLDLRLAPRASGTVAQLELDVPAALDGAPVDVAAYDITGRRLRTLLRGVARAGVLRVDWALDDEAGAAVANGLYFVSARVGSRQAPQRVIVVR